MRQNLKRKSQNKDGRRFQIKCKHNKADNDHLCARGATLKRKN